MRVAPGDTLLGLARAYGVSARALIAANRLEPPYLLEAGSLLRIPRRGEEENAPLALASLPPPKPAPSFGAEPRRAAPAPLPAPAEAARPAPPPPKAEPATTPAKPRQTPVAAPLSPPPAKTAALARAPAKGPAGNFSWPLRGRVIAGFGPGPHGTRNEGINIAAPRGAPVEATAGGTVVYTGNELRGYGNLVLIKHKAGWISAYAHLDVILVKRGERVSRGQVIARVGATGSVGAPQLHFELRRADRAVDPMKFLAPLSTAATPARPRRG